MLQVSPSGSIFMWTWPQRLSSPHCPAASSLKLLLTTTPIDFSESSPSAITEFTLGHMISEIIWPKVNSVIALGDDSEKSIGVVVRSNFKLLAAGQCGDDKRCGHVHMKIDPDGDTCNIPGRPYNSNNSDFGGDLVKTRF